ncbi:MAG: hypothetical protein AAF985_25280, partial [Bacteroidota bacterium]
MNLLGEGTVGSLFLFFVLIKWKRIFICKARRHTVEIKKIEALLAEKFQEEEFTDCFLVDLHLSASNKLEIFVDSDSGITFKKCQQISRFLEKPIDEEGWLGEKYTLEVSSPGISRPLKFQRQYPKNIGRKLEVKLLEGGTKTGKLTKVEASQIILEEK